MEHAEIRMTLGDRGEAKELLLPLDSAKQSRDVTNKIIQLNYETIFKMAPLRKWPILQSGRLDFELTHFRLTTNPLSRLFEY